MRTTPAIVAALLLSACTTIPLPPPTRTAAPAQYYRPPGERHPVQIIAELAQTPGWDSDANDIIITIDGQPAITGTVSGNTSDLSGQWNGVPVIADCTAFTTPRPLPDLPNWQMSSVKCVVSIDGDRAAAFVLSPL